MIDTKILRNNPDKIKANCMKRSATHVEIDKLLEIDSHYLRLLNDVEGLRAKRNQLSKECQTNPDAREIVKGLKQELSDKEVTLNELKVQIERQMSWLPNFLSPDVPEGNDDADNEELKIWGEKPVYDFDPLDHQELGERLDIIDAKRGAKVAQSGFYFWKGKGAQLVSALFFWAQQELVKKGFTLFITPCAAKEKTLYGTGYLPFFADQTYQLKNEDLALIGTSEQVIVAYHGDEILPAESLPLCYTANTPCFRTEAGSYGKETRGIFRVHQFQKVEQIVFCLPEESERYHEMCLENEEYLLQQLNIPYRVVNVCIGDLGAPGYKKYDVDAYFSGFGNYREVCSNTNLTDFQARRLGVRYQENNGKKGSVHTISATAVTDRVACAIMENFQEADGTIIVPDVLRPFTGFDRISPKSG